MAVNPQPPNTARSGDYRYSCSVTPGALVSEEAILAGWNPDSQRSAAEFVDPSKFEQESLHHTLADAINYATVFIMARLDWYGVGHIYLEIFSPDPLVASRLTWTRRYTWIIAEHGVLDDYALNPDEDMGWGAD